MLRRHSAGPVYQVSGYVGACHALDAVSIAAEYRERVADAPTRSAGYIVEHDTSGRKPGSRRTEEMLDDVDALIVPADLRTALQAVPDAEAAYEALNNSAKKQYLWWIHSAKRPATRSSRIDETIRRLSSEGGHRSS